MNHIKQKNTHQLLTQAVIYHQSGELNKAKKAYEQLIKADRKNAESHHLLGLLYHQENNLKLSVKHQKEAVALNANELRYIKALVDVYFALNDFQAALDAMFNIVESNKADDELILKQGYCFQNLKNTQQAMSCYCRAVAMNQKNWQAYLAIGNGQLERGNFQAALDNYEKVLSISPNQIDAINNIGTIYLQQGEFSKSLVEFCKVVESFPAHYIAWTNMASALLKLEQFEEAINCCQKAIEIEANYTDSRLLLALCYRGQGAYEKALAQFEWLLEKKFHSAELYNHIGNLLKAMLRFEQAEAFYQKALIENNQFVEAYYNLGVLNASQKKYAESIQYFQHALQLNADYHQARAPLLHMLRQCCRWSEADEQVQFCRELLNENIAVDLPPFSFITLADSTADEQLKIAHHWTQMHRLKLTSSNLPKTQYENQRLKIGYLSADFHEHATAYLLARVIELHDKTKFETFAYSYGPDDQSPMRQRLIKSFEHFRDVERKTSTAIAQMIQADEIDILIDLKGFTQNSRSQILSLRPAPIQINFLGYPATMGKALVDYAISDRFISQTQSAQFEEEMIYLNGCYQPTDNTRELLPAPKRSECGLPEEGFIFGAFHQSYKMTAEIVVCWCEILKQVPGSILWCLSSDNETEQVLLQFMLQQGITHKQVIFAKRCSASEHLARLQCVDLMLDTFPVNGHTSTSDALWAEIPVVTIAGETFISRVAASLLHYMALDELVCDSIDAYKALAVRLALSPNELDMIQSKIIAQKKCSSVFDSAQYTRDLENLLSNIWQQHKLRNKAG